MHELSYVNTSSGGMVMYICTLAVCASVMGTMYMHACEVSFMNCRVPRCLHSWPGDSGHEHAHGRSYGTSDDRGQSYCAHLLHDLQPTIVSTLEKNAQLLSGSPTCAHSRNKQ